MDTNKVSGGIELLVDHFRANPERPVTLGDVSAVTEVLISAMQRYFSSIDVTIYAEFRSLSDHISRARSEIAELRPNDLKEEKLPRAGRELDAIVQSTEEATGTIMDAAEEIMAADPAEGDDYQTKVNDACMRIFEACSFQDITGQRISKVVRTMTYIEDRLNKLQQAWGPGIADAVDSDVDPDADTRLLNGPALAGEGIDQDSVDDLFNGATVDTPSSSIDLAALAERFGGAATDSEPATETSEAGDVAEEVEEMEDEKPGSADENERETEDETEVEIEVDVGDLAASDKKASQAEIDAMFD